MKITLSPQLRVDQLALARSGDILTINGEAFDFGPLLDGSSISRGAVGCHLLASAVDRIDGELNLTLILPHGANASSAVRFPAPIIDPPDGSVDLPQ